MIAPSGRHAIRLDDADIRLAAALMLVAGCVRALLPGNLGVPCPLRSLTGIPCPLCGMTTSVTDALRLDVAGAFGANPGGIVLVVLAVALLAGPGRRLVVRPWVLTVGLAASWLWELHRFSIL